MNAKKLKANHCLSTLQEYKNRIPEHLSETPFDTICEAIEMKEQAIFKDAKFWVTMTDKFMSGWGLAKGKTNKMIVACETYEQAEAVQRNAKKSPEMIRVNICANKPRINQNVYPSWKHYEDLGEIWTQ